MIIKGKYLARRTLANALLYYGTMTIFFFTDNTGSMRIFELTSINATKYINTTTESPLLICLSLNLKNIVLFGFSFVKWHGIWRYAQYNLKTTITIERLTVIFISSYSGNIYFCQSSSYFNSYFICLFHLSSIT